MTWCRQQNLKKKEKFNSIRQIKSVHRNVLTNSQGQTYIANIRGQNCFKKKLSSVYMTSHIFKTVVVIWYREYRAIRSEKCLHPLQKSNLHQTFNDVFVYTSGVSVFCSVLDNKTYSMLWKKFNLFLIQQNTILYWNTIRAQYRKEYSVVKYYTICAVSLTAMF